MQSVSVLGFGMGDPTWGWVLGGLVVVVGLVFVVAKVVGGGKPR